MPALPEIRDSDAPGNVRAIYDDIKSATGIPQVNLIFRHLATDQDVLAWAWETVGPLYRDGSVTAAANTLLTHTDDGPVCAEPIWTSLPPDEARAVRNVLAFYNRGNPANLIGMTALIRAASAAGSKPHSNTAFHAANLSDQPIKQAEAIPPLPQRLDLSDDVLELIDSLAARQGGAAIGVTPSLYLHLGLWPQAMRRAHACVIPLLDDPGWLARVERTIGTAEALADDLVASVEPSRISPNPIVVAEMMSTISRFVCATIPEMILIGRQLAGRCANSGSS